MKKTYRSAFRKMRKNLVLLIATSLLVFVGTAFFITLFTITQRFDETAEIYFAEYNYADCTYYGIFDSDNVLEVQSQDGVINAAGRNVSDFRDGETLLRAVSLTQGINDLFIYEGNLPANENQCLINKKSADAMVLKIGGNIKVNGKTLTICGIADSPEYIFLAKNNRDISSDPLYFGLVFVNADFFEGSFNQIVVTAHKDTNFLEISNIIGAQRYLLQSQQNNYMLSQGVSDRLSSFAYIFPSIFAFLIITVVYIILRRTAHKEIKQISVFKALGAKNFDVIKIYLIQFLIFFIIAALLGGFATVFLIDVILGIMSSIFTIPILGYYFYSWLWAFSIIAAIVLCLVPGVLSLIGVLKVRPAQGLRASENKNRGKKILLERTFVWKKLSFNTRYTFKNMFRSLGRFFAVVFGITGAAALLILSFGFFDSTDNISVQFFDNFSNYDMIAEVPPTLLKNDFSFIDQLNEDISCSKALVFQTSINGNICTVTVIEEDFDKMSIDTKTLKDGIIVPQYYADLWGIKIGETLAIDGLEYVVNDVTEQLLALSVYIGFDYFSQVNPAFAKVYNMVYLKGDVGDLIDYFNQNNVTYITASDEKGSFDAISSSTRVLNIFMIACSLILGVTVLYAVGLLNISARQNEYMLMQTLGYKHSKIMLTWVKETIIQIILAIPIGIFLGRILLNIVKNSFTNATFVMISAVYPLTYIFTIGIVLAVATIVMFAASRQINRLNITEGLKEA